MMKIVLKTNGCIIRYESEKKMNCPVILHDLAFTSEIELIVVFVISTKLYHLIDHSFQKN